MVGFVRTCHFCASLSTCCLCSMVSERLVFDVKKMGEILAVPAYAGDSSCIAESSASAKLGSYLEFLVWNW
jgi:hypothetical protein